MAKEVSSDIIQSADKKYYGSGQRSVIQQSRVERRNAKAIPTPRFTDPKQAGKLVGQPNSSDIYYANDGKAVLSKGAAESPIFSADLIIIADAEGVTAGINQAINDVKIGMQTVRVGISDPALVPSVQRQIDLAIAGGKITEEQAVSIKLGMTKTVKPVPAPTEVHMTLPELEAKIDESFVAVKELTEFMKPSETTLKDLQKFGAQQPEVDPVDDVAEQTAADDLIAGEDPVEDEDEEDDD